MFSISHYVGNTASDISAISRKSLAKKSRRSRLYSNKNKLYPFRIIILSFLVVILAGTVLLMIPAASAENTATGFSDALFTSVSAVCVTGLVVVDTAAYWSGFGKSVIIILIQIGGMGVVTAAASLFALSGRKIGLLHRNAMQEDVSAPDLGGIIKFNLFIVRTVLAVEAAGTVMMAPVFCSDFGIEKGLAMSAFHSISAFCNAGFDLMGAREPFSSLTLYSYDPLINITVTVLVVMGGIGFMTWDDIKSKGIRIYKYKMQSKVVLCTTVILILLPFLYFFFWEFKGNGFEERIWTSVFQAVTPRTAGFNTVDMLSLSHISIMAIMFLMFIGGSPGSTAGGMKTTNAAILAAVLLSVIKRENSVHMFGRRIDEFTVRSSVAVFLMYVFLFTAGGIAISLIENLPVSECLFEALSAICTVGLSLGITPALGDESRVILEFLMFFGRAGGLTMAFAAVSKDGTRISKLPEEKIAVG